MRTEYIFYIREKGDLRGAVAIKIMEDFISIGGALCADADQFSRKIGRAIAFGRAASSLEKYTNHALELNLAIWSNITLPALFEELGFGAVAGMPLDRYHRLVNENEDRFNSFRDVIARRLEKADTDETIPQS